MEAVNKARARYLKFPKLLLECRGEATAYAACVSAAQDNIAKDQCRKDFEHFVACLRRAAAKLGTRI
ncbi:hypothetical protein LSTR_LSTR016877 [Laodelphax striatellus]|uniref:IMS import disulfide relay-system CHCH-CHCH-like Cx9C domain-containing protein n=1 Tax=Laodelphax striatellus TaxID=195883 RepID=A0A482XNU8_LAOST|nr:hypothetical protein LSTR_LSTR008813 [Laodelphax striatellus]RZF47068.1 hypothetical protein LSTR_LSTR016877 [Laodelphax striatellus]